MAGRPAVDRRGLRRWLCHRRADIEHTAGAPESLLHLVMFAELGVPLLGIVLRAVLHPTQLLALFGLGSEAPRFEFAWKDPPLPAAYIAGVSSAVVLFSALPYLEELVRGMCARGAAPIKSPQSAASANRAAVATTVAQTTVQPPWPAYTAAITYSRRHG